MCENAPDHLVGRVRQVGFFSFEAGWVQVLEAFRRKLTLCFQSAWIFFCIASNCCQVLVFRFRFSFWYGNLKEVKKKLKVSVVDKMSFQELLSLRATKSNNQEQEEPRREDELKVSDITIVINIMNITTNLVRLL